MYIYLQNQGNINGKRNRARDDMELFNFNEKFPLIRSRSLEDLSITRPDPPRPQKPPSAYMIKLSDVEKAERRARIDAATNAYYFKKNRETDIAMMHPKHGALTFLHNSSRLATLPVSRPTAPQR